MFANMGDICVGNMFPRTSVIISLTILICVALALLLKGLIFLIRCIFCGQLDVNCGINLMAKTSSICQALLKYPLATTDIFLSNIARSTITYEKI